MALYALIRDGAIAEYREADAGSPAHKLAADGGPLLRPVIDPGAPTFNPTLETYTRSIVIDPDAVRIQYAVERRPLADQKAAVKAEAQRRIIALTGTADLLPCMIKQSNANMRANALNDKRLRGETLTEAEATEAEALRQLGASIEAIRAKSNEIEAMQPIPLDYTADARWS